MQLTARQKSNIRHFVYYLVNGTLDHQPLHTLILPTYRDYPKTRPDVFYKTCCVFINHEVMLEPSWPQVKRLAQFVCKAGELESHGYLHGFENWEIKFEYNSMDLSGCFKAFSKWFIENGIVEGVRYSNYIEEGASFVEQCFAIWANVIDIEDGWVTNREHAKGRVAEYIKSYFDPSYMDDLQEWEVELFVE